MKNMEHYFLCLAYCGMVHSLMWSDYRGHGGGRVSAVDKCLTSRVCV